MEGEIFMAVLVVELIAYWRIFTKAGEKGWKALIPYYNGYILFKISWKTSMFWAFLALLVFPFIFAASPLADSMIFAWLSSACAIAGFVVAVMCMHKLSKAFGHGVGFTLGLIFLNVIFVPILGFGSSEYKGADL